MCTGLCPEQTSVERAGAVGGEDTKARPSPGRACPPAQGRRSMAEGCPGHQQPGCMWALQLPQTSDCHPRTPAALPTGHIAQAGGRDLAGPESRTSQGWSLDSDWSPRGLVPLCRAREMQRVYGFLSLRVPPPPPFPRPCPGLNRNCSQHYYWVFSLNFLLVLTEASNSVLNTFRPKTGYKISFCPISSLTPSSLACEEEGPPIFCRAPTPAETPDHLPALPTSRNLPYLGVFALICFCLVRILVCVCLKIFHSTFNMRA